MILFKLIVLVFVQKMAEIFKEIAPGMEDLFAAGSGAVVLALANSCRRLSTLQAQFLEVFLILHILTI